MAPKNRLVDDCVKVPGCKGVFENNTKSVPVHFQLRCCILPFIYLMLMQHKFCVVASHKTSHVRTLHKTYGLTMRERLEHFLPLQPCNVSS